MEARDDDMIIVAMNPYTVHEVRSNGDNDKIVGPALVTTHDYGAAVAKAESVYRDLQDGTVQIQDDHYVLWSERWKLDGQRIEASEPWRPE